ncbi:MAG: HlyD family efflux transporter periplasmic adaptor subunit [Planctomycetes bacterium]|nr:HlyD family efflux transporter periplasmic adaptor subunit [Planctomycetota bacterium]
MMRHAALFAVGFAFAACGSGTASPPSPPASPPAQAKPTEAGLWTIELGASAAERLGIGTAPVAERPIGRVRRLPGRFERAPGARVTVQAPFAGRIELATDPAIAVGAAVAAGATLARLVPLAGPDTRATLANARESANGRLTSAIAAQEAARIALSRAERLLADRVGSVRAVDEATATLALADAARTAAAGEVATIDATLSALGDGATGALPIVAPRDAIVAALGVLEGQLVPAGAALFDLEDQRRLWLRVEVPQALAPELELAAPVRFGPLSLRELDPQIATPVAAPPQADPATLSVLAFFAVDDIDGAHRPGQRCAVTVAVRGAGVPRRTVPAAAIVRDAGGGTWVYERLAPLRFARRRIDVEFERDGFAVLAAGPAAGVEVVTSGAAELFGTEFGAGK